MAYHNLTFGGINSANFGVYISANETFKTPERVVSAHSVPGKNGDVLIDEGRDENVSISYKCFVRSGFMTQGRNFIDKIKALHGYQRIEDTVNNDTFRVGFLSSDIDVTVSQMRESGYFDLTFNCKPQKYLKSGDEWQTVTQNQVLTNPTAQTAYPLIRVYGTGNISIGGVAINVLTADGYTDLDSEICDAYKGSTNCNGNISQADVFPTLAAGDNTIQFAGFTRVQIKTRWWRAV